ncbi:MAG TPA: 16S rRNA (guanine(966)-N(2))-methyltransferase RsmD [Planctomycetes bacterium]|nr:16S rRNA (guanine(966)-N(2))-methyltransferase RsmD [Planctomycetota bacterium]
MRIIAGKLRGRKVEAPSGRGTRPMLDRVREALFNILQPRLPGSLVWDLFAGSGSLGLEALSRGARKCWFVERDPRVLAVLKRNMENLLGEEAGEAGEILKGDGWRPPISGDVRPDLVFLDPPYAQVQGDPFQVREWVLDLRARLAPGGLLVFHYPARNPEGAGALDGMGGERRMWGTSALAFLPPREEKE